MIREPHTEKHDNWDQGGYCNALVQDANGDADTCGYRRPYAETVAAESATFEATRTGLASTIWTASRADEGTISATGADVVADAVIKDWAGPILDRLARQAVAIERISKAARSMNSAGPTQRQLFDAIMEIRAAVDEVRR